MSRRPPHRFREYPMTLTETDCTAPVASIPQPPLDLHRLEQFVAVVETGSLTDAAVRLSVSQQALSVAIRALEKQVGVTLFIRGKGMRPSPAGLHLYESAQILLAAARRMVPELRAIGEAHTERLRVGYTPLCPPSMSSRRSAIGCRRLHTCRRNDCSTARCVTGSSPARSTSRCGAAAALPVAWAMPSSASIGSTSQYVPNTQSPSGIDCGPSPIRYS